MNSPDEKTTAAVADSEGWNVYRDERGLTHLPGPNPGTPYTACMVDAGLMKHLWASPYQAALWCTACFQAVAYRHASFQDDAPAREPHDG